MNNLLIDLGLEPRALPQHVDRALTDDADSAAVAVLGDPLRRRHYERMHLQYNAIAATAGLLQLAGTVDSHGWADRTVEFTDG